METALQTLSQAGVRDSSLSNGDGPWTTVSDNWSEEDGSHGGCYAAFAQPSYRNKVLGHAGWDLTKGRGGPGFALRSDAGQTVVDYKRNSVGPEIEPLVLLQEFHGIVPDTYIISEEFRLLMNLWLDPVSGNYFEIRDDGSKEEAIQFSGDQIKVRTPLLRRYQAARQLDLVLFVDSSRYVATDIDVDTYKDIEEESCSSEELNLVSLSIGKTGMSNDRLLSRLLLKRVLAPPPQEYSGIWPWDGHDEVYPDFIIAEDFYGQEVRSTCNPENLDDHFSKNPEAPHYLTPVFFDPEVLRRYYDDPALYSITDGYLRCGQLWDVRIDNGNPDVVVVFLGDIGRDIPSSQRTHWLAYNIPPSGSMSESNFRRAFFAQSVETESEEHLFKHAYQTCKDTWFNTWGWDLYREPSGIDQQIIRRLRIPLNESDTEFSAQLLDLAKLLVDSLNEREITRDLEKIENEKSLGKFERFLKKQEYVEVERDMALLRHIQTLRSKIAAHTSGASGQRYLANELNGSSKPDFIRNLMKRAREMFLDLSSLQPWEQSKAK